MSLPWIKLFCEMLEDPKMGRMSEWLFCRCVKLFLMAGREGKEGMLPPVEDIAWSLRIDEDKTAQTLRDLAEVGVTHQTEDGSWCITNFSKRQASMGESAIRTQRYRQNRKDAGMPSGYTYSHQEIIKRDNSQCVYCGKTENLCVDHILPIKQGGTDDTDNLACACKFCNSGKSGRTPEQAGYKFVNKEAEERYQKYITVTRHGDTSYLLLSTSDSSSDSSSSLTVDEEEFKTVYAFYTGNLGALTSFVADAIREAVIDYTAEWVTEAMKEAVKNEARNWKYVEAILKNWKTHGFKAPRPGGNVKYSQAQQPAKAPTTQIVEPKDWHA